MSKEFFCGLLVLTIAFVYGQNVNNVRLVDHRGFMTNVLTEIGHIVEEREWCNLKIAEFQMEIDQVIFTWEVNGTAHFQNGFVVSIERLEILQSSLNQIWSWNNADGTGTVEVRGTLRMHNMLVGFDVVANFNGNIYRSSATYLHPMISFEFSIFRNTQTLDTTISVNCLHPLSNNKLNFLPVNNATYVIRALYHSNNTFFGISDWSSKIFHPIAEDVVANRISFPEVCYNCPVT